MNILSITTKTNNSFFKQHLCKLNIKFNIEYLTTPTINYCKYILDYELSDNNMYIKEYIGFQKPKIIKLYLLKCECAVLYMGINKQLLTVPDNSLFIKYDVCFSDSSNMIYFNYTPDSIRFLTTWEYLCNWPKFAKVDNYKLLMLVKSFFENENRCNTTDNKCVFGQLSQFVEFL